MVFLFLEDSMTRLALPLLGLFAIGCGSVAAAGDAGPDMIDADPNQPDAEPDQPDAQVGPGTVSVTVFSEGSLAVGVDVVFIDPDGQTVIEQLYTGGDGRASAEVPAGSSV